MGPRNEVAILLNCDIVVSKFKHGSHYNIQFLNNIIWKVINPIIIANYGLNNSSTVIPQR